MQIIDALRRSNTAEEICLLLANYLETLQFYAAVERLPLAVVALPVRGPDDVEHRYFGLRETRLCDLARSRCTTHGGIIAEAEDVLHEALCCLRALGMAAELPRRWSPPPEISAHTSVSI